MIVRGVGSACRARVRTPRPRAVRTLVTPDGMWCVKRWSSRTDYGSGVPGRVVRELPLVIHVHIV